MVSDEVGDSAWSSLAVPLIPLSAAPQFLAPPHPDRTSFRAGEKGTGPRCAFTSPGMTDKDVEVTCVALRYSTA